MTNHINSNIPFAATWTPQNTCLKSTFAQKVSRFSFNLLHKYAMRMCLSPPVMKRDTIDTLKQQFSEKHSNNYQLKDISVLTPDGVRLQGCFLQKIGCPKDAPCVIFMQPSGAIYPKDARKLSPSGLR